MRIIPILMGFVYSYAVIGDTGRVVVVDAGFSGSEMKIVSALKKNGVSPADVSLIHITHGHADHFGGAHGLKRLTGAPTSMHRDDIDDLEVGDRPSLIPLSTMGLLVKVLINGLLSRNQTGKARAPAFIPDIAFDGPSDVDLAPWGVDATIIHTPGHSYGSTSVIVNSEIIVGDLMSAGILKKGQPKLPLFAVDLAMLRASIARVKKLKPSIVHCSHGGVLTFDSIERSHHLNI